jgi:archaemetzincin
MRWLGVRRSLAFAIVSISVFVFGGCARHEVKKEFVKVGLQPFGNFDPALMDTISRTIEKTYGFQCIVLNPRGLPAHAFTNLKVARYRADKLIGVLKQEMPDSLDYIMGLTNQDISFTKKDEYGSIKKPESKYEDWGIFGLGYRPGPSSVVSTFRIKHSDKLKFVERVKKISLHELGHNLGLEHCKSEFCLMRDAVETIKTIDQVKVSLCPSCKNKIP